MVGVRAGDGTRAVLVRKKSAGARCEGANVEGCCVQTLNGKKLG